MYIRQIDPLIHTLAAHEQRVCSRVHAYISIYVCTYASGRRHVEPFSRLSLFICEEYYTRRGIRHVLFRIHVRDLRRARAVLGSRE